MKSVAFIFLALVGVAGAAHAQPADPYGPGPYVQPGPPPPVYLPAPVQPVPGPMPPGVRPWRPWHAQGQGNGLRAAILARFDRNHDGVLEPQERRRAIRALRRIARRMARQERRAERRGW